MVDPDDAHTSRALAKDLRQMGYPVPRTRKRPRGYYANQANAIIDLQMREAVIRMARQGMSNAEIGRRLGQHPISIYHYRRQAIRRSTQRALDAERYGSLPPPVRPMPAALKRRLNPPKPKKPKPRRFRMWDAFVEHRRMNPGEPFYWPPEKNPNRPALPPPSPSDADEHGSASSSSPPPTSGTVLDPPDMEEYKRQCLYFRKAMVPFDIMAEHLQITVEEARYYTFEAIQEIEKSEMMHADAERRLMIEQIDQMIAGIHAPATGRKLDGSPTMIDLGAIDRMLKLFKQKAELLGLTEPPAVDIRIKLQQMATERGYELTELEEIARDVLVRHRINLPEARG